MQLKISHQTTYRFDGAVTHGLQQIRMSPKSTRGQQILWWKTTVTGGTVELSYEDHHRNKVVLVSFGTGTTELTLECQGEVGTQDTAGVVGPHEGNAPLWMFQRHTRLTTAGRGVKDLLRRAEGDTPLMRLHDLSRLIGEAVTYQPGFTDAASTAEEAIAAGQGVCQDHAHVFVSAVRELGLPARYVSGYLFMEDTARQEAMHAWAEAHLPGLGWVGFDPANAISPDPRYVRVATGLDYAEAAPVRGTRVGASGESLEVMVEVVAQQ